MPLDPIDQFVAALRVDPAFGDASADAIETGLRTDDALADENVHVAARFEAILFILREPRTTREQFEAIYKIVNLEGQVHIPCLRTFLGWNN